jgi:hypothetical protein
MSHLLTRALAWCGGDASSSTSHVWRLTAFERGDAPLNPQTSDQLILHADDTRRTIQVMFDKSTLGVERDGSQRLFDRYVQQHQLSNAKARLVGRLTWTDEDWQTAQHRFLAALVPAGCRFELVCSSPGQSAHAEQLGEFGLHATPLLV